MQLYFGNAWFDSSRSSGDRTHIESLINGLHDLGHRVWVRPGSGARQAHQLPEGLLPRWRILRRLDATYLRFEGYPLPMSRRFRLETAELRWRRPVIWEMNATSDFCALMWEGTDHEAAVDELDAAIMKQASEVQLAVCNTAGLERYARYVGIRRTAVIPLGTDPGRFRPDAHRSPEVMAQRREVNVVWCGSAEIRWHDLDLIIEAAHRLRHDQRFRFFFVGRIEPFPDAPENVAFLGEVPRRDLPSILSCMDVGLALYREPSWSRFGVYSSPLKLFDYLACGLVVMASPIEQVLSVVRDHENGFLIPFGDGSALVACLMKLSGLPRDSRLAMGERGRQEALRYYNWDRVARQTVAAITRVL